MSHTTTIGTVKITDANALKAAVRELKTEGVKCDLVEKVTARMYSAAQTSHIGVCDYVLRLHAAKYDVAFVKQTDGSYLPVTDLYQNSVSSQIGASCPMPGTPGAHAQHAIGRLMQGYAKHAAINAARKQGYTVTGTRRDKDGNVHVKVAVN